MVALVRLTNSNVSNVKEIGIEVKEALSLLQAVKAKNGKITVKKLEELLIEYIIANMKGDQTEMQAIAGQIQSVFQTYQKNIKQAQEIKSKLEGIEDHSGKTSAKDLTYLQNLIAALKQDVSSGDMSNLSGL